MFTRHRDAVSRRFRRGVGKAAGVPGDPLGRRFDRWPGQPAPGPPRGAASSILSEDTTEWIYTDLGVQSVGGIVSGVYPARRASRLDPIAALRQE